MIDITGVDLVKFTQKVYTLSSPQGLGRYSLEPGGLDEGMARGFVEAYKNDPHTALDLDYVNGRACKMIVLRKEDKLIISDSWYDHADHQFEELLSEFNITLDEKKEHSLCCACVNCMMKKPERQSEARYGT